MTKQCDVCVAKYSQHYKRNKAKFFLRVFYESGYGKDNYLCGLHLAREIPESHPNIRSSLVVKL